MKENYTEKIRNWESEGGEKRCQTGTIMSLQYVAVQWKMLDDARRYTTMEILNKVDHSVFSTVYELFAVAIITAVKSLVS